MELELKQSRISIILHMITGTIAGYASSALGSLYGIGIAILLLFVSGFVAEKIVSKKGIKWWLGNGAVLYFFVWIVSWILFFNIF